MNTSQSVASACLSFSGRMCNRGLLFLAAVLIAGCSHDFVLRKPDGSLLGPGNVDFSAGNSAGAITLEIDGKLYRGSWEAHKVDESRSVIANYGFTSRRYQAYSLGSGDYLREGQATLHSGEGKILKCEFFYRGVNGRGSCESGSEKFDIIITEPGQTDNDVKN